MKDIKTRIEVQEHWVDGYLKKTTYRPQYYVKVLWWGYWIEMCIENKLTYTCIELGNTDLEYQEDKKWNEDFVLWWRECQRDKKEETKVSHYDYPED